MSGSIQPTGPGIQPLAPTPGTDFVPFAVGAGANVEAMATYQSDPLRQTGNLPGLAISNFNNRALRQACFGMAGVSTFIWEVLQIYVPDDGDLANWVANFRAALQAFITPGGTLPGGPYLPLSGGTMVGNINFQSGATIVLANNTYLRALDVGGTAHGMLRLGTDGNHYIGDGSAPLIIFGSTPTVGSGIYWSARDTGGTTHGLLGIQPDNNTYLQAFNSLNISAGTVYVNTNIVLPNNNFYYGKNSTGGAIALLGTDTTNITRIAQGAPSDTYIYAATGRTIFLSGTTVSVTGTLSTGNVTVTGTLNVSGTTTLSSTLQVNGATNLYARLNVVNSVGATITGDVLTNSLHVTGATALDGSLTVLGTSTHRATTIYIPGTNDPLTITGDNGTNARIHYTVSGVRTWTAGCDYAGRWVVADDSAGRYSFYVDTDGQCYCVNHIHATNFYGTNVLVSGVYIGGTSNFYDGGGNWITSGANLHMGGSGQFDGNLRTNNQFNSNTVYTNYVNCAGSSDWGNDIHCNTTMTAQNVISRGDGACNGNQSVAGYLTCSSGISTPQHLSVGNGFCLGGAAMNMDYTLGFPYGGHAQWASGLGVYAQFFASYSDERFKQNVETVEKDALAAILPLQFFRYDVPRALPEGGEVEDPSSHTEMGFTAQQVRESMADAVIEATRLVKFNMDHPWDRSGADDEVGCDWQTEPTLALNPMTMIAYAMRAIQQLSDRIKELEGRVH